MSAATTSSSKSDDFFIGWEPPPRGDVRFLRLVCALILMLAVGLAALIAVQQSSPGTGQWDSDKTVTFDGVALARPYALLRVPGEPPRTFLLVEEGKFGALERIEELTEGFPEGRAVRVSGTILHRDGRWMFELAEGANGVRPLTAGEEGKMPRVTPPAAETLAERITLLGEVVDPKCYLGAMKPGGGKTHKGCAALCISGGIPPMLVVRDADKRETFYLLVTAEGGPAGNMMLPIVGDQVEIAGRLERHDDILVLAADAVRRR